MEGSRKIPLIYRKKLENFRAVVNELSAQFVGRFEEVKVIALAALCGEHALLIGEPGTAKSMLIRSFAEALNARYFQYLMTKFTEPSELLGVLDITALKKGVWRRITTNKLPECEIAFLDEIFKASSAILNTLLTLLNERVIYDGTEVIKVPLWTLYGASNDVPYEAELAALYDRFLFRHFVKPVQESYWEDLLKVGWNLEKEGVKIPRNKITLNEVKALSNYLHVVSVEPAIKILTKIFGELRLSGVHVTDRRKIKALKAIAAHALYNGRDHVTKQDLIVLKYVVPRDEDEVENVVYILNKYKILTMEVLDEIEKELNIIEKEVERSTISPLLARELLWKLSQIREHMLQYYSIIEDAEPELVRKYRKLEDKFAEVKEKLTKKFER